MISWKSFSLCSSEFSSTFPGSLSDGDFTEILNSVRRGEDSSGGGGSEGGGELCVCVVVQVSECIHKLSKIDSGYYVHLDLECILQISAYLTL